MENEKFEKYEVLEDTVQEMIIKIGGEDDESDNEVA